MIIDPSHPRAISLRTRERLVWGIKKGITSKAGLIAHGRGEAFDYLIGEKTKSFAMAAIKAASALLLLAKHPILSVNGNTAALTSKEFIKLAKILNCRLEVNLFHSTKKRTRAIENYLSCFGKSLVLSSHRHRKIIIPGIASPRKIVLKRGIGRADVVFVPLEDGDRTKALVSLGKKVITIDLNPLSRTARSATVTIVDNITRAMPLILATVKLLKHLSREELAKIVNDYDNKIILSKALLTINSQLKKKAFLQEHLIS